jgi:hypothetical protein
MLKRQKVALIGVRAFQLPLYSLNNYGFVLIQSLKRTLKPVQLALNFVCLLFVWTSVISAGGSIPIEAQKQPPIA